MTIKKCDFCGNEFQAKRSDARFCGNTCKARAWDKKKETGGEISIQNSLRGVIRSEQVQKEVVCQPQMIESKEFNPLCRGYFQTLLALNIEQKQIKTDLKDLENKRSSAGTNYGELAEMTMIGSGALLGQSAWENTMGTFVGGAIGGLVYNIFKLSPEQQAVAVQQALNNLSVQERKLNVRLTSVNEQISVLTKKFKETPNYIIKMVEKPGIRVGSEGISPPESSVLNRPQDVQTDTGDTSTIEVIAPPITSEKIKTSIEVRQMEFKALGFNGEWNDFLGSPSLNFSMVIHGLPGQGKSTFSLLFALYLAENFGKVIYITAEEGFSKTMQDKLKLNKASHPDLHIADLKSMDEIKAEVNPNMYNFIFIDSLNVLHIDIEDLHELHKRYQGAAMITVSQSTKDGKIRGSQEIVHVCDIAIDVTNGVARTTKNRFQATPKELEIFNRLS